MKILVDTHILIWVVGKENKLSGERLMHLESYANQIFVSQLSLMELAIKKRIGKLPEFIADIEEVIQTWIGNGYQILPLTNDHILAYQQLSFFEEHRDPFDRFIIATAIKEKMALMSDDKNFPLYKPTLQLI